MVKCGQLFVKWDFKKKQLSLRSGCEGVMGRVGFHVGESKHPFVLQEPIGGPRVMRFCCVLGASRGSRSILGDVGILGLL